MGISVFLKSLLLGPLLSTISLEISMNLEFDSPVLSWDKTGDFIDLFLLLCLGAYLLIFTAPFGGVPGIIPLLAYSTILALSIDPLIECMSKRRLKAQVKVMLVTLLSLLIGLVVYGSFFQLATTHTKELQAILFSMVIPTSIFFGIWFGITYVRKYS